MRLQQDPDTNQKRSPASLQLAVAHNFMLTAQPQGHPRDAPMRSFLQIWHFAGCKHDG